MSHGRWLRGGDGGRWWGGVLWGGGDWGGVGLWGMSAGSHDPPGEVLVAVGFRAGPFAPTRMGDTILLSPLLSLWAVGLSLGGT